MKKHLFLILYLTSFAVPADMEQRIRIVSWNMEHLMSEEQFIERMNFCSAHGWKDPQAKTDNLGVELRPESMNYCNALNGLKYPTDKRMSLPLQDIVSYRLKVKALNELEQEIRADIYALQEVRDADAVFEIFDASLFEVFSTKYDISQNVAFAVRKSFLEKNEVSMEEPTTFKALSVEDQNGHVTRPGFVATFNINGHQIVFLNVHLKSGCRSDAIDNPTVRPDWDEARRAHKLESCRLLRKQVPILEAWVDDYADKNFLILGDLNRDLSKDRRIKPQRLDGTIAAQPITTSTKIGGMFFEISDNDPVGATLQNLNNYDVFRGSKCHYGIDHFLLGAKLSKLTGINIRNTRALKVDYADRYYGVDKAKPSDHCPIMFEMRIVD